MKRYQERESKYDIAPEAELPDLNTVMPGVVVSVQPEVRLSAAYFDTFDLRLLRRGVTLRRRSELSGQSMEDLWTLKLPEKSEHATLERSELSWPGTGSSIPSEAVQLVSAITQGHSLGVVAKMMTFRRRSDLVDQTGRTLAEVDDDLVSVTTQIPVQFRQIEVELDAGDDRLIESVTSRLAEVGAKRSRDEPKLRTAIGDRLIQDVSSTPHPLNQHATLGEVAMASIAECLERLVSNDVGIRLGGGPESVHQARVATRRLRSDLKTFRRILDSAWVHRTRSELKWLGGALGAVRDADVLTGMINQHALDAAATDAGAFTAVLERLRSEKVLVTERLEAVLGSQRYLELLQCLDNASSKKPIAAEVQCGVPSKLSGGHLILRSDALARDALGPMVRRPWRELRRAIKDLGDNPKDVQLHLARIKAKQLRYASEAAIPIFGKPARHLALAAEDVQTVLGEHHDAVTSEQWLRKMAAEGTTDEAFAGGQCIILERDMKVHRRSDWPALRERIMAKRLGEWIR